MSIESNLKTIAQNTSRIVELLERISETPDAGTPTVRGEPWVPVEGTPEATAPVETTQVPVPPSEADVPKPASTPVAEVKSQPVPAAPAAESPFSTVTLEELNEALKKKASDLGSPDKIFELLESDYGHRGLSKIDPSLYAEIKDKVSRL